MFALRRTFHTTTRRLQTIPLARQVFDPPAKTGADPSSSGNGKKCAPIVFLHGLFGSKQNSRSISKVLAKELNTSVHVVDCRNHGDSPHDPEHTYSAMAADVEAFIKESQLEKPALIGHSMGAKTAMTLALRNPTLLSSLIAVDNSPTILPLGRAFTDYARGMLEIEAANVTSQRHADQILAKYEPALPVRQFLLTNLVRDPATNKYRFRIPVGVLSGALDEMAGFPYTAPGNRPTEEAVEGGVRFEGPALFVRGTRSHYVGDEAVPLIRHFFPRAEVVDVEAGHWLISERPEEFRDAVVRFLSQNTA